MKIEYRIAGKKYEMDVDDVTIIKEELKPCPFCGHAASIESDGHDGYFVICTNLECYCTLGYDTYAYFTSRKRAIEEWNKRV